MSVWMDLWWLGTAIGTMSAVSCVGAYGTFVPASRLWGRNISHGPRDGARRVAITFDDGPTPGYTDQVMDILDEFRVPATFFVVGANVASHPDLLRRMDAASHLIGNHTYDHSHFGVLRGSSYWLDQLRRTDEVIHQTIGKWPGIFRPPMGFKTWSTMRAVRVTGQRLVTWSRRAMDGIATTPQRILNRLVPRVRSGDILTLHDGVEPHTRRHPAATIASLRPLLQAMKEREYQIVRLDELIGVRPYVMESD